jgi:hypothetical protein
LAAGAKKSQRKHKSRVPLLEYLPRAFCRSLHIGAGKVICEQTRGRPVLAGMKVSQQFLAAPGFARTHQFSRE